MNKSILIFISTSLIALLTSFPAHAIKKCKDAEGKWHYGDRAVRSCEASKVTTLDERGFIQSEKEAPKTADELAAEKEAFVIAESEAKRKKAEEDERNRILGVYETEADIDRQRDNQLDSVQSNIAVHKSYLKSMEAKIVRTEETLKSARGVHRKNVEASIAKSKSEIKEYTERLGDLKKQKEQIVEKFAIEKETYRALKGLSN